MRGHILPWYLHKHRKLYRPWLPHMGFPHKTWPLSRLIISTICSNFRWVWPGAGLQGHRLGHPLWVLSLGFQQVLNLVLTVDFPRLITGPTGLPSGPATQPTYMDDVVSSESINYDILQYILASLNRPDLFAQKVHLPLSVSTVLSRRHIRSGAMSMAPKSCKMSFMVPFGNLECPLMALIGLHL